jgi:elongator complex protein 1
VALTTYDFELVTLVATQTQKDPKEYVPYLQELKSMEPTYMKFKIESDLKNFEQALTVISESDSHFDEALSLIKKHRLFKLALSLYEHKPQHILVKRAFGDYLMTRGYTQEAGFLYMGSEATEDIEKSLTAFKKGGNVEMCVSIGYKLGYSHEEMTKLNVELVEILANAHSYKEAGDLLCSIEGYQEEKAIEYYNKGN